MAHYQKIELNKPVATKCSNNECHNGDDGGRNISYAPQEDGWKHRSGDDWLCLECFCADQPSN